MARPSLEHLTRTVQVLAQTPQTYIDFCYRCVKPKYGNSHTAFSGEGSKVAPGRFHVKGAFLIIYASSSFDGAQWEYTHTARSAGLHIANLLPMTTLSARLKLTKILDLTDNVVLASLGVTVADMRDAVWNLSAGESLTQCIGRLAYASGFEGILAPSGSGYPNINLLPQNILPTSTLEIINEQDLLP